MKYLPKQLFLSKSIKDICSIFANHSDDMIFSRMFYLILERLLSLDSFSTKMYQTSGVAGKYLIVLIS